MGWQWGQFVPENELHLSRSIYIAVQYTTLHFARLHYIMGMFVWSAPLHFATLQKFCSFTLQLVSEACFPLHYISLQSDLLRYILLHRSLTNSFARLHYATLQFVSEACLRCFPLHSDIPVALSDPLRHPSAPLIGRCNDRVGQKCKLTRLVALFSTVCFQMCDLVARFPTLGWVNKSQVLNGWAAYDSCPLDSVVQYVTQCPSRC